MVAKDSADPTQPARVIARYPNHVKISTANGSEKNLPLTGQQQPLVGDWVTTGPNADQVAEILPRDTLLVRRTRGNAIEPVVANVTQIAVVVATLPKPDWGLLDRYLVAARTQRLDARVIYNKADLEPTAPVEIGVYKALGYPIHAVSATTGAGLDALANGLKDQLTVLVGQSGVGKSSLMNALVPSAERAVSELSAGTQAGRHTTSAAELKPLPGGGALIDAPGVRDYYPPTPNAAEVEAGFAEIQEHAARCRFRDCRHQAEPGCGVKAGLSDGTIASSRLESFRRLLALAEN